MARNEMTRWPYPRLEEAKPSEVAGWVIRGLSTAGFALVETVMAVVLLGVAVAGLTYWQVSIIRANSYAERLTVATNLAQERMAEIRLEPFGAVRTESASPVPGYPAYLRWLEVTSASSTLKEVHVKVAWSLGTGATKEIELVTLVSDRE